jgi:hypothetical protein
MTLAVQEFAAQWQLEQEQWLYCAFRNLAPGGAGAKICTGLFSMLLPLNLDDTWFYHVLYVINWAQLDITSITWAFIPVHLDGMNHWDRPGTATLMIGDGDEDEAGDGA